MDLGLLKIVEYIKFFTVSSALTIECAFLCSWLKDFYFTCFYLILNICVPELLINFNYWSIFYTIADYLYNEHYNSVISWMKNWQIDHYLLKHLSFDDNSNIFVVSRFVIQFILNLLRLICNKVHLFSNKLQLGYVLTFLLR